MDTLKLETIISKCGGGHRTFLRMGLYLNV